MRQNVREWQNIPVIGIASNAKPLYLPTPFSSDMPVPLEMSIAAIYHHQLAARVYPLKTSTRRKPEELEQTYQRRPSSFSNIPHPLVLQHFTRKPGRCARHENDGDQGDGRVHDVDQGSAEEGKNEEGQKVA